LVHEYGVDQVIGGEQVLAHQAPREPVAAHPPRALVGIGHGDSSTGLHDTPPAPRDRRRRCVLSRAAAGCVPARGVALGAAPGARPGWRPGPPGPYGWGGCRGSPARLRAWPG